MADGAYIANAYRKKVFIKMNRRKMKVYHTVNLINNAKNFLIVGDFSIRFFNENVHAEYKVTGYLE